MISLSETWSKQTLSLTCTLAGPTASSAPCTTPAAIKGGESSGASYSGLRNGTYTFTATFTQTDGATAAVSRSFTVDQPTCSGQLSASVPAQDGARSWNEVYSGNDPNYPTPPGADALDAVIYRGNDIELDSAVTSDCAGSWTYAWSYRLGDGDSTPVPTSWTGASSSTLTVPKWTLQFFDLTHEDYTFTVTATPPVGAQATPVTASLDLRVAGRSPRPGFSPTGFDSEIPPGTYTYKAFGGTPSTLSPDWPPDDQEVGITWTGGVYGGDDIAPDSGQYTPTVDYTWAPAQFFHLFITVCAVDAPTSPTNYCASTPDFVFITAPD